MAATTTRKMVSTLLANLGYPKSNELLPRRTQGNYEKGELDPSADSSFDNLFEHTNADGSIEALSTTKSGQYGRSAKTQRPSTAYASRDGGSHKVHLQVEPSKTHGILTTLTNSLRVSILRLNSKGDALIHDGKRIMMVDSKFVSQQTEQSEEIEGVKRFEFVKRIYAAIMGGSLLDTSAIYDEVRKWLS